MKFKEKQAFTLVELIVVITILAILGTIAFISLQGYSKNARDSTRVSDVASMRKTLELYELKNSKVPLPDNGVEVLYDNELLRTQGFFGENVAKGLGKLLSKAPLDPLTNINYIYSVENIEKEYEILMTLEGNDLANNKLGTKVNADGGFTPIIKGNYNGIFVQNTKNLIPTPSIINAEINENTTELALDGTNIKSQVVNGEDNIPKIGDKITENNNGILQIGFEPVDISNGNLEDNKDNIIQALGNTYNGTTLKNEEIDYVLNALENGEEEKMFEISVLSKTGGNKGSSKENVNYSCDETTKPEDNGHIIFNVGTPIEENQVYSLNSASCGYSCTEYYSGDNCEVEPGRLVFTASSFYGSGTVLDRVTNLEWIGTHFHGSWYDARDYCSGLGNNWRVPTRQEIINISSVSSISTFFTNHTGYYRSSEGSNSTTGYYVKFSSGFSGTNGKSGNGPYRCIR